MGQQQLLLLVLGIVIVGLAVVVGIQAFGENQKKANSDALVNDGVRIASDVQAWILKPAAFGGGDGNFENLDFGDLGYTMNTNGAGANAYGNLNGVFNMTVAPGEPGTGSAVITGCNADSDNLITITVDGTTPNNITTVVATSTEACPGAGAGA
ncbi:hypothetical protein RQM47_14070 [Rubrivirga sp. S365]|uniref:Type 4 secretion system PilS N-terminal domain-containing protein n=1 Tax=Rubrivirga litoralis TaxID=3075598 RepID=A0ABU3BV43_9BACT|nr:MULTISPECIES: hypothetical protein [unclassified Rubrivirga]MDT0633166.1 hypothetical protein [Rubrivirga sp. F394]MDT7857773.1 hypothetical protein [Rubrivirga sp. S365]